MITNLVGIPYSEEGLTPESGFNCYSLVRWVLNGELNVGLPEKPPSSGTWGHYVKIFLHPLPPVEQYDILMFSEIIPGLVNHIGLAISQSDFIHTGSHFGGVVCEPIDRYERKIMGIGRPLR